MVLNVFRKRKYYSLFFYKCLANSVVFLQLFNDLFRYSSNITLRSRVHGILNYYLISKRIFKKVIIKVYFYHF